LPADAIVSLYFLHAGGTGPLAQPLRFNLRLDFLVDTDSRKVSKPQSLPAAFADLKQ
jgi:hypothetical protein